MTGIIPMAVITLVICAGLWGGLLYYQSGRIADYLGIILCALPLSAIVNLGVKAPLGFWVGDLAHSTPAITSATPIWYGAFLFLLAPVFEEAIKLTPLVFRPVKRLTTRPRGALWVGSALGLGFGLGEAAFLAYRIHQAAEYADIPWYQFTGFLNERLLVCLAHALLTGIAVSGTMNGGRHGLGSYLLVVLLHAVINIGIIPVALGLAPQWTAQIGLWVGLLVAAAIYEHRRSLAHMQQPDDLDQIVYFRRE